MVREEGVVTGQDRRLNCHWLFLSLKLLWGVKINVYKSFKTSIHSGLVGGFSSCHPIPGSPAARSNPLAVCALWVFLKDKYSITLSLGPGPLQHGWQGLQLGISLCASQAGPGPRAGPAPFLVWES